MSHGQTQRARTDVSNQQTFQTGQTFQNRPATRAPPHKPREPPHKPKNKLSENNFAKLSIRYPLIRLISERSLINDGSN